MSPKYHIYPSLLDSFAWYKKSEAENGLQEFLDKLNRVQTAPSDAMLRGIAFEKLLTDAALGKPLHAKENGTFACHDIDVHEELVGKFEARLEGSVRQVFVESVLDCAVGPVRVYGYVDNILRDTAIDTKTTGKYEFPKYLDSFQRPVYLEGLRSHGIDKFQFLVTDFRELYVEDYHYNPADTDRLIAAVNELVDFIEANRDRITDTKLFTRV
jgi:hypothetical protein